MRKCVDLPVMGLGIGMAAKEYRMEKKRVKEPNRDATSQTSGGSTGPAELGAD